MPENHALQLPVTACNSVPVAPIPQRSQDTEMYAGVQLRPCGIRALPHCNATALGPRGVAHPVLLFGFLQLPPADIRYLLQDFPSFRWDFLSVALCVVDSTCCWTSGVWYFYFYFTSFFFTTVCLYYSSVLFLISLVSLLLRPRWLGDFDELALCLAFSLLLLFLLLLIGQRHHNRRLVYFDCDVNTIRTLPPPTRSMLRENK